jgi:uncharacterized repeat protein (TIGR04138 family)
MQETTIEDKLSRILAKDPRYHREAYRFLREALEHTRNRLAKGRRTRIRHVSGQELLDGIRQFALTQFGPMAPVVFAEWGVHRCRDFGEIVFNMIEVGLLEKTEEDSRADFEGGYDFDEAFRKPFLPEGKRKPESKTA